MSTEESGGWAAGLAEGQRMFVEVEDGTTRLARIRRSTGLHLEVDILDKGPGPYARDRSAVCLLTVDPSGARIWPCRGSVRDQASTMHLVLTGTSRSLQRRQHPRFTVDLTAPCHASGRSRDPAARRAWWTCRAEG